MDATVNVLGTLTILEGMRRHGLRKIVYSSSSGIFGEAKTQPVRDCYPAEPLSPYGATKNVR